MPPGASGRFARLRPYPWNLIRLIPAKGARHGRGASVRVAPVAFSGAFMTATVSRRPAAPPPAEQSYGSAFPNSTKVFLPGARGIRVPMREIALSGGEPPLRVYDSSGPQGVAALDGVPGVREAWIARR